jgi:hypothetical protein
LPANQNAAEEGNEKLQALAENFQQKLSTDRLEWLKSTVAEFESQNRQNERLLLILIVPHEDKRALYIAGLGPMKVVVSRGGGQQLVYSEAQQGKVVSGWLQTGDVIAGGTSEFVDEVWNETSGPLGEKLEDSQAAIGSHEQQSLMAGVVLAFVEPVGSEESETSSESVPGPIHLEMPAGEVTDDSSSPLSMPSTRPPRFSLPQRLMGGHALAWMAGKDARPTRKASLVIGGIFLLLLLISVAVGSVRKEGVKRETEFLSVVEPLEHSLEEASDLRSVNPVRARSLVAEVRAEAEQIEGRFTDDPYAGRWQEFIQRLNQVWTEVSGERVVTGSLWLDLTVIRDYLTGSQLIMVDENTLGVVDRENGAAVTIGLSDKSAKVVGAGDAIKQSTGADAWAGSVVVLTSEGVSYFSPESSQGETLIRADGEIWDQITHVAGFAGNIYLAGDIDIWRYPGLNDGVAGRGRWLRPGTEPNLSSIADWAIDGQIWVLTREGRVLRFNQGIQENFEIKGLVESLVEPTRLAVNTAAEELLILDRERGSVVVISQETGEYQQQLVWDQLKRASDLVADPSGERFFAIIGSELYEISLK